jgi:type VI secretion system secreted protein VgrG
MAQKPITIVGPDKVPLTFLSMSGTEGLGRCFEYFIDVLSADGSVTAKDIVGQPVTVSVPTHNSTRYFNGLVAGLEYRGTDDHGASSYRLVVRPWLWFLSRTQDCRIFQPSTMTEGCSTLDILKKVFTGSPSSPYPAVTDFSHLQGNYKSREYVVQYRETDFHFVTRLMEAEGIYYYFVHENGKHTMVFADSPTSPDTPAHPVETSTFVKIPFASGDGHADATLEHVSAWSVSNEAQPGAYFQRDYDFDKANAPLETNVSKPEPHDLAGFEVYEYPGGFSVNKPDGEALAALRLQQLQARFELAAGAGNATDLAAGVGFTLTGHPRDDQNKSYLVTAATYRLHGQSPTSGGSAENPFSCSFIALDATTPFRMPPTATKPTMRGPQTATVVGRPGPPADEIYVDKYGRVKVQFHWDRIGTNDDKSSCYVRVAQIWAGAGWGAVFTPRVGQEVIVDFLEGDPDQPIIVGRLHNSSNMPPYDLANHPTVSGVRSHSSPGGNLANFNEIRFEDLKGKEELYIQAENVQTTLVKGDQSITVGGNRARLVGGDDSATVGTTKAPTNQVVYVTGNRTILVDKDQFLLAGKDGSIHLSHNTSSGNTSELVIANNGDTVIRTKNGSVTILDSGDMLITNGPVEGEGGARIDMRKNGEMTISNEKKLVIKQKNNSIEFTDGKIVVSADDSIEVHSKEITITAGKTSVHLTDSLATVAATEIKLTAGSGTSVDLTGSAATITASTINLNA